jgi:sulfonate transport system substrate-binding protein
VRHVVTLGASRQLVLHMVILAVVLAFTLRSAGAVEVRMGYQKSSTLITLLKSTGSLDEKLTAEGARISWHEFTSGAPLLEALNVGGIDLSADVADTVPIFALAAGSKFAYYAQETPSPAAQAILVRADSPIRSVAQLSGKRVAVAKAAGAHYLLLAALETAGLKLGDVQPSYLTPADGRAAFERGSVDAWAVWDPYFAGAQQQIGARVLVDGSSLASYRRYYLASAQFARAHPQILRIVFEALQERGKWVKAHSQEAAAVLAPLWGLDAQTAGVANSRRSYDVRPVTAEALREQQKIANAFLGAALLPEAVNVAAVEIWKP